MIEHLVLNEAQLACLASPACNEIVQALRLMKTASATDLARVVEKTPATVHYHLKCLLKVEMVEIESSRATLRRPEAVFALVAKRFSLPNPATDPSVSELASRAVLAGIRQVMRGFSKLASKSGVQRHVIRSHCRLSPEDTKTLMQMISEASDFASSRQDPKGEVVHWSSVLYSEPKQTD